MRVSKPPICFSRREGTQISRRVRATCAASLPRGNGRIEGPVRRALIHDFDARQAYASFRRGLDELLGADPLLVTHAHVYKRTRHCVPFRRWALWLALQPAPADIMPHKLRRRRVVCRQRRNSVIAHRGASVGSAAGSSLEGFGASALQLESSVPAGGHHDRVLSGLGRRRGTHGLLENLFEVKRAIKPPIQNSFVALTNRIAPARYARRTVRLSTPRS